MPPSPSPPLRPAMPHAPPGRSTLPSAGAGCLHACARTPAGASPAPGQRAGRCSCRRGRRRFCRPPSPRPRPAPGWLQRCFCENPKRRASALRSITDVRSSLAEVLPGLRRVFPKSWLWRGRWGNLSCLPARPWLATGPPPLSILTAGESLEPPARLCQRCSVLTVGIPVEGGIAMSFPTAHPPSSSLSLFSLPLPCLDGVWLLRVPTGAGTPTIPPP